jgi:hypothetical protein
MKRISRLVAFALLLMLAVTPVETLAIDVDLQDTCTYKVCLYDSRGDGWYQETCIGQSCLRTDEGKIDVEVNGATILSQLQMADGYGPDCYDILVSDDDVITLRYDCVYPFSCGQNSWKLRDAADRIVLTGNGADDDPVVNEATADCDLPVGGLTEPRDVVALLAPWLALASLLASLAAMPVLVVRRLVLKRRA